MKENIKYIPLALIAALGIKGIILGFSFADAPICAILASLTAYYEYNLQNARIKLLEQKLAEQKIDIENIFNKIGDMSSHVQSMKMANNIRSSQRMGA